MKQTIGKNILKKASILLVAAVLILSMVAVTANTNTNNELPKFMSAHADYVPHPQQTNTFDSDWIHFDNGNNVNALGLTQGGTFEFAIRLTPDELAEWTGYDILTVRHCHGWVEGTPFQMSGNIKIYGEGTSTNPGALITSEPFEVIDNDWFDVILSEPVSITGDKDIWVSVEAPHNQGEYPAGFDDSEAVDGKGDWLCLFGVWQEMQDIGYDYNFNIWAGIAGEDTIPPVTNCTLEGEMEGDIYVSDVTVTLTATDDQSGVNYTMYRLDDGENQSYAEPFNVSELGEHIVYYHSVDKAGNVEEEKSCTFVIGEPAPKPELEITSINGFIGLTATIKNVGEADATDVEWKITVRGGILDRIDAEAEGNVSELAVDDSITTDRLIIIGFGNIDIRVTAEASNAEKVTQKATAFVIGIFVIGITLDE